MLGAWSTGSAAEKSIKRVSAAYTIEELFIQPVAATQKQIAVARLIAFLSSCN